MSNCVNLPEAIADMFFCQLERPCSPPGMMVNGESSPRKAEHFSLVKYDTLW